LRGARDLASPAPYKVESHATILPKPSCSSDNLEARKEPLDVTVRSVISLLQSQSILESYKLH